jgi:hypothetical protein
MKTTEFREKALLLLPRLDADNLETRDCWEDLGEGWKRMTTQWSNPPMLEVQITYEREWKKKADRRKSFGIFCYKHPNEGWVKHPVFRIW